MRAPSELFDSMLNLTTDLFEPLEHDLFIASVLADGSRRRVLDIGSGNGAYLARIQMRYPHLFYEGIELAPAIHARSLSRHNARLTIHCGSYEQLESNASFDLIVARLVVPHLADRVHFGRWLLPRMSPQARLLILELDEDLLRDHPQLELYSSLYRKSRQGLNRSPLMKLQDSLKLEMEHAGLCLLSTQRYHLTTDSLTVKAQMYMYMRIATEYMLGTPVPAAHAEELFAWLLAPESSYNVPMFGMTFCFSRPYTRCRR